ncbi:MAG: kinase [Caulobacteraceae bacterium]|nr:kinase [Caulobacteraceae bacterium]
MAATIAERGRGRKAPFVVGLCGPQGSGKSTAVQAIANHLAQDGVTSAVMPIDDLYLTRGERRELARRVHPLLATRGPPGTHDVALGLEILTALGESREVRAPRFDKAMDDRVPQGEWPVISAPVDCVLFEGWCVGARPQPDNDLVAPVNALEAREDLDGVWRRFVNSALAGTYQTLFARIDLQLLIRAPDFQQVLIWRTQQEEALRRDGDGPAVMGDAELARFVQHYERLTRWIDAEMPGRADIVVELEADRTLRRLTIRDAPFEPLPQLRG